MSKKELYATKEVEIAELRRQATQLNNEGKPLMLAGDQERRQGQVLCKQGNQLLSEGRKLINNGKKEYNRGNNLVKRSVGLFKAADKMEERLSKEKSNYNREHEYDNVPTIPVVHTLKEEPEPELTPLQKALLKTKEAATPTE